MVTILLVISHWLGDFVLQSAQAAVEKQKSFAKLVKHCLLYALVIALGLLLFFNNAATGGSYRQKNACIYFNPGV
jgi:phage-related holin